MKKKKPHIILEGDKNSVRLDIEGTKNECVYMIAHYYVSNSEFRDCINMALRTVMTKGINFYIKCMGDED